MFRSNSVKDSDRAALDRPSRMHAGDDTHSPAGPAIGTRRKPHYGIISRVTATNGWKATFMSV